MGEQSSYNDVIPGFQMEYPFFPISEGTYIYRLATGNEHKCCAKLVHIFV